MRKAPARSAQTLCFDDQSRSSAETAGDAYYVQFSYCEGMNHQSQGLAEDYFAADSADPTYSRQNRRFTGQHRQLLNSIALESTWSGVALRECLRRAATSDLTESWGVGVLDAWTDGPAAFCVVY